MPKLPGTILPTPEIMRAGDVQAERDDVLRFRVAAESFAGWTYRRVGGEHRWYRNDATYGIVSANGTTRLFRVTEHGDFAC